MQIIDKLNSRLAAILEQSSASWKDPRSPSYDRQYAEDCLYHTIGPLTDNPRWASSWTSNSTPPPEFEPGGKAPKWTPEEVIMAYAGDPKLLFAKGESPRSPRYGDKGGSPMYRLAKKTARRFGKENDKQFIADLYSTGFIPLLQMMKPGYDEGRSPFISYVHANVRSAMELGTGTTEPVMMATGKRATYWTNPEGKFKKRADAESGWTEQTAIGLQGILEMDDPEEIRKAANIVKGKYRTERHHDKHADNPFGPFSPAYYKYVNDYADAIESGDEDRINEARNNINKLLAEIEEWSTPIRGASTGLGQAISTKDRAMSVDTARQNIVKRLEKMQPGSSTRQHGVAIRYDGDTYTAYNEDGSVKASSSDPADIASAIVTSQGIGVHSIDSTTGDDDDGAAWKEPGTTEKMEYDDKQVINYVLTQAMKHDIGGIIRKSRKYTKMALDANVPTGTKTDASGNKTTFLKISGPLTANEFRYVCRSLGHIASDYPGKGKVRSNLRKPRGAVGWWKPGEDPEIEPIPDTQKLWHSIWSRTGYNQMGATEIAEEMTNEALECGRLGIPHANTKKAESGKPVASRSAVSRQLKMAKIKLMVVRDIYKHNIGESVIKDFMMVEDVDQIDRDIIVEACDWIINKITIAEKAPPGWKKTVEKMKKNHPDKFSTDPKSGKLNPFAIAWAAYKRGDKPKSEGKMIPVDTIQP